MGEIQPISRSLSSGGGSKECIKYDTRRLHIALREGIIVRGRQKNENSLDWKIWEGFMEEVACEVRLKDRWGGFQEEYIQGQEEKDTFQVEKQEGLKQYGVLPEEEVQSDKGME